MPLIIFFENTLPNLPQLHELLSAPWAKNRQEHKFHVSITTDMVRCNTEIFNEAAIPDFFELYVVCTKRYWECNKFFHGLLSTLLLIEMMRHYLSLQCYKLLLQWHAK